MTQQKSASHSGPAKQDEDMSPRANIHPFPPVPLTVKAPIGDRFEDNDIADMQNASLDLDRSFHALAAIYTGGVSPSAVMSAWLDWFAHLSLSPGKRLELQQDVLTSWVKLLKYIVCTISDQDGTDLCIKPHPQDNRFSDSAWQSWPFNIMQQSFLLMQNWWGQATTNVSGVSEQHERMMSFGTRQILDMISPSNFFLTNPEILQTTFEQQGQNLVRGMENLSEDLVRLTGEMAAPVDDAFKVGVNLATTPGKVIYRNHLIELIQYSPVCQKVDAEPVVITPAWIMKYYILDLSPQNSLAKYMVEQGHTVFMISWRNPTEKDRNLGLNDYLEQGVLAAINTVRSIQPDQKLHLVGYCLGGTLAAIAAAYLSRQNQPVLKSLSLFAAQVDFSEAGELTLFINESQVAYLEKMMWKQGVLDERQMSSAFQMLRSNDLIWSRLLSDYWLGKPRHRNDLMAWNADGTRMPYKMHSEYLRKLFLNNDFAEGRLIAMGKQVAVSDIRIPIFAVGTMRDHVAPWESVYKLHILTDSDVTFALTSGGHNAGIVSEPGHANRSYQIGHSSREQSYIAPEKWQEQTPMQDGSWWPAWHQWLSSQSKGQITPPEVRANFDVTATGLQSEHGHDFTLAPGTYVFQQ